MIILGIESSCDETAASIVKDGRRLISNVVHSQIDIQKEYGGVVPEIAARSHLEVINPVINQALKQANMTWTDIDAIAVTYAPGLIGGLLIGTLAARTLAIVHNKPLYPIHHVEAHVYANFITEQEILDNTQSRVAMSGAAPTFNDRSGGVNTGMSRSTTEFKDTKSEVQARSAETVPNTSRSRKGDALALPTKQPAFPMLALIVSGGHSQLVLFRDHGDYELLGQTQDDAIGEAFDKVAKILGLPYPGGPSVSNAALQGDPYRYKLPKARLDAPYNFSFSGLKTAVLRAVQSEVGTDHTFPSYELAARLTGSQQVDFAASFQHTAIETLVDKAERAFRDYSPASVVIAGGVAANQELRRQLTARIPIDIEYAPPTLCTDNAAMIATLGYYYAQNAHPTDPYDLDVVPSLSMTKTAWNNT